MPKPLKERSLDKNMKVGTIGKNKCRPWEEGLIAKYAIIAATRQRMSLTYLLKVYCCSCNIYIGFSASKENHQVGRVFPQVNIDFWRREQPGSNMDSKVHANSPDLMKPKKARQHTTQSMISQYPICPWEEVECIPFKTYNKERKAENDHSCSLFQIWK